jgi:uncharacterized protein YndB with AHSA1/START domain
MLAPACGMFQDARPAVDRWREAALDSPALREGWHAPEPGWRCTTGDAAIAVAGVRHLAFQTAIAGRYWTEAAAG